VRIEDSEDLESEFSWRAVFSQLNTHLSRVSFDSLPLTTKTSFLTPSLISQSKKVQIAESYSSNHSVGA
jgi:hypothetical protein